MLRSEDYKVNLISKNEGVEYIDNLGTYRFEVYLYNKVWEIYLPCTFGDNYEEVNLTADYEKLVIDRIATYLKNIRWFGLFKRNYKVKVLRKENKL